MICTNMERYKNYIAKTLYVILNGQMVWLIYSEKDKDATIRRIRGKI